MQRIVASALATVMIVLLAGCTPKKYQYIDGDGYDYLIVNKEYDVYTETTLDSCEPEPYIQISKSKDDPIKEMIEKIKTGDFTEYEFHLLCRMETDEEGRVILPDLNNLLEVIPPEGVQLNSMVIRNAGKYSLCGEHVTVTIGTERTLGINFQNFLDKPSSAIITETSTETEIEAARTAYYIDVWDGTRKFMYLIQTESAVYYVEEKRDPKAGAPGEYEKYGDQIRMYTKIGDDLYMRIIVTKHEEQNNIDWLTSFSVKPYSE